MKFKPLSFIDEIIEVGHDPPPVLEKTPGCPSTFKWRGEWFDITEILSEWHNYKRKGRMTRNIRTSRMESAERKGSWGVGRFYFRVRTNTGRVFDLYYDRAPVNVNDRKGKWLLFKELIEG